MELANIKKYDKENMIQIYDKWPEIARKSFESNQISIDCNNIDHIVFAGMGGSGSIGDLFSAILSKKKIHVSIVKGYILPSTVNAKTLVIPISVSGNTAETLSILKSAHKLKCNIIAFSSGGKMQTICKENRIPHRVVVRYHSPRASFPSYFYTILKVLHSTLNIEKQDIDQSIIELEKIRKKICSSNLTKNNLSLSLAEWITHIPVIYFPYGLQSAAIRFKNSLQENSKIHAFAEDVIEACHNGIVSWEKQSEIQPILIVGKDDHEKTIERWQILKEFFNKNEIPFKEIISIQGSILSKLINLIYVLDYSTIYLAIENEIDPSPVKAIDFVKARL